MHVVVAIAGTPFEIYLSNSFQQRRQKWNGYQQIGFGFSYSCFLSGCIWVGMAATAGISTDPINNHRKVMIPENPNIIILIHYDETIILSINEGGVPCYR